MVNPQSDLSYVSDGLFTTFVPNTPAGEDAWRAIAAKEGGVAKVLSIHEASVLQQLRRAGYTVRKARKSDTSDIDVDALLAELEGGYA